MSFFLFYTSQISSPLRCLRQKKKLQPDFLLPSCCGLLWVPLLFPCESSHLPPFPPITSPIFNGRLAFCCFSWETPVICLQSLSWIIIVNWSVGFVSLSDTGLVQAGKRLHCTSSLLQGPLHVFQSQIHAPCKNFQIAFSSFSTAVINYRIMLTLKMTISFPHCIKSESSVSW